MSAAPGASSPRGRDSVLVGAGLFLVYAFGASRTIFVGDSGELTAAVQTLGIPHPTGYPLYVLLGRLFTLVVPIGSIAFRVSLFSAACAAAACGLLHRLARESGLGAPAALLSALLLAFAPSFWGEANIQRVYALNALFVALATLLAARWHRTRRRGTLALAFLAAGLGAANHTYMAVWAFALVLFALLVERSLRSRPWDLVPCGIAFGLGLLPYLYLPLRSRANPVLDWGNPETLHNFLDVVLRRDFWNRAWIQGPADLVPIGLDYVRGLGHELAWGGVLLALAGAALAWRRAPVLLALLAMAGNLAAMALHGSRSDIFIWHRYYIPSIALGAYLAGLGAEVLFARLPSPARLLPLALPAFLLVQGWRENDRHRYRIAEAYSRALLHDVPPGGHLIASDDNILFVLIYLHHVERVRPDVDLILQGVGGADLPPLHFDPDTDPVFFADHPNWNVPALKTVAAGLVFRTWRAGRPYTPPPVDDAPLEGELDPRVPKDYLTHNLIGHYHYMRAVTLEETDWPRARAEFTAAMAASPQNDVLFYNLGLIFLGNGLYADAEAAFRRSKEIDSRGRVHPGGPVLVDRGAEAAAGRRLVETLEAALGSNPALAAPPRGTPARHRRLAELLAARGEIAAARGELLLAREAEATAFRPR